MTAPITQYFSGNMFGMKRIVFDPARKLRTLLHDEARHGMQSTDPARRGEPLAYFHRSGPLGDVFGARAGADAARVAVIGLGIGSIAAYAESGQHFTFFEIDPGMASLAADTQYFTFLDQCRGTYEIVIGDALLTLGEADHCSFDLIIQDAYVGDAIPTHLVSPEALDLYLAKLTEGGLLVFHVSNVHVELDSVLAELAAQSDLVCVSRADFEISEAERALGKLPAQYVVMARHPDHLGLLAADPRWTSA